MGIAHSHVVHLVEALVHPCIRNMVSWLRFTTVGIIESQVRDTKDVVHAKPSALRWYGNTLNVKSSRSTVIRSSLYHSDSFDKSLNDAVLGTQKDGHGAALPSPMWRAAMEEAGIFAPAYSFWPII